MNARNYLQGLLAEERSDQRREFLRDVLLTINADAVMSADQQEIVKKVMAEECTCTRSPGPLRALMVGAAINNIKQEQ